MKVNADKRRDKARFITMLL